MTNTQTVHTNPMAVAALVLGILSLLVPFVGFVLAILGIVFGAIGVRKAPPRRGMSHWGLWLSVLGLVWPVLFLMGVAGLGGLLSL